MNYIRAMKFIIGAELLLFAPLIGMMLSDEVNWGVFDFIFASVLLAAFGFAVSLIANRVGSVKQIIVGLIIAALILVTWAELAVGIFGSPIAGS